MSNDGWVTLAGGDVLELDDARGTTLSVARGSVWITQERDTRDITLRAGDAWTIERSGLTLVAAREAAAIALAAAADTTPPPPTPRADAWQRLATAFASYAERVLARRHVPYF